MTGTPHFLRTEAIMNERKKHFLPVRLAPNLTSRSLQLKTKEMSGSVRRNELEGEGSRMFAILFLDLIIQACASPAIACRVMTRCRYILPFFISVDRFFAVTSLSSALLWSTTRTGFKGLNGATLQVDRHIVYIIYDNWLSRHF